MKAFDRLQEVKERLMGPDGCPWDKEQTLKSLRTCILEETYEVMDAIDQENPENLVEELGDLFWGVVFLCRLVEKEYGPNMDQILNAVAEKLVRRHPHVFGDVKLETSADVVKQWDQIKKAEKKERVGALDHLPKSLSALMRAQMVFKRLRNSSYLKTDQGLASELDTEEKIGNALLQIARAAQVAGVDAELALNQALRLYENDYLAWEAASKR
jgi:tetrapyrrole methylase family protein/MazG family protein